MNWSARILEKSELSAGNELTYKFMVVGDDADHVMKEVTGHPESVQQLIADAVREYGAAWELAQGLPVVGDVLSVVSDA